MKNICILSGIHRGAVVKIGDDPVLIGGGEECDALLSDDSAEGAVVSVSSASGGDLVATGVRGSVRRGVLNLREGRRMKLPTGSTLHVGGVDVTVGDDLASAQRAVAKADRRLMLLKLSSAGVLCVLLVGAVGIVGGPADAYNSIKTIRASSFASDTALRDDPVSALERRIGDVDLSNAIGIVRESEGRIVVTGSVSPSQRKRWDEVVRWYDGRFGGTTTLDARIADRDDDIVLPFRIVSVTATPSPQVVIQNGNAYPVGSILPGGWEVRRIAGLAIVLARGNREVAISF